VHRARLIAQRIRPASRRRSPAMSRVTNPTNPITNSPKRTVSRCSIPDLRTRTLLLGSLASASATRIRPASRRRSPATSRVTLVGGTQFSRVKLEHVLSPGALPRHRVLYPRWGSTWPPAHCVPTRGPFLGRPRQHRENPTRSGFRAEVRLGASETTGHTGCDARACRKSRRERQHNGKLVGLARRDL
jgi:hypothetical protein